MDEEKVKEEIKLVCGHKIKKAKARKGKTNFYYCPGCDKFVEAKG